MSEANPKSTLTNRPAVQVCLLGASFDTGNMGVSALAESSVKCILTRWPEARITLLGSGRREGEHRLRWPGRDIVLRKVPIRFCKNILVPYHFLGLLANVLLLRLLPFGRLRRWRSARHAGVKLLLETDYFIDISGGDSFSDIYGLRRLTLGFLVRLLPLLLKKDLILFPQTYGPFRRAISRRMARYILQRARRIYSRDQAGLEEVRSLMFDGRSGNQKSKIKNHTSQVRFSPDVAFILDPRPPKEGGEVRSLMCEAGSENQKSEINDHTPVLVGLNVSGLLYYGGYTGRNEFGLKADYRHLIDRLVDLLLQKENTRLLLVPHVIPRGDFQGNVENDLSACLEVYERWRSRLSKDNGLLMIRKGSSDSLVNHQSSISHHQSERLFVARGPYDHSETKYLIGRCGFFLGSRMHACIAALSQYIPAVGLSYSKKFRGVFETAGVGDLVLELRAADVEELVASVEKAFASRAATAQRLRETIPALQQQVLAMLEDK